MNTSIKPEILFPAIFVTIAALVCLAVYLFGGWKTISKKGVAFSVLPSALQCISFYALAMHMFKSLGSWPMSIGESGFPPGLITHSAIAGNYFGVLVLGTLFAWPIAFLVCSVVRPWRKMTVYLSIHIIASLLCLGLMQMAPAPYLNWWWD